MLITQQINFPIDVSTILVCYLLFLFLLDCVIKGNIQEQRPWWSQIHIVTPKTYLTAEAFTDCILLHYEIAGTLFSYLTFSKSHKGLFGNMHRNTAADTAHQVKPPSEMLSTDTSTGYTIADPAP